MEQVLQQRPPRKVRRMEALVYCVFDQQIVIQDSAVLARAPHAPLGLLPIYWAVGLFEENAIARVLQI